MAFPRPRAQLWAVQSSNTGPGWSCRGTARPAPTQLRPPGLPNSPQLPWAPRPRQRLRGPRCPAGTPFPQRSGTALLPSGRPAVPGSRSLPSAPQGGPAALRGSRSPHASGDPNALSARGGSRPPQSVPLPPGAPLSSEFHWIPLAPGGPAPLRVWRFPPGPRSPQDAPVPVPLPAPPSRTRRHRPRTNLAPLSPSAPPIGWPRRGAGHQSRPTNRSPGRAAGREGMSGWGRDGPGAGSRLKGPRPPPVPAAGPGYTPEHTSHTCRVGHITHLYRATHHTPAYPG